MIYTVGHAANYRRQLGKDPYTYKLGKKEAGELSQMPFGYTGGYAFRTRDDAQRFLRENNRLLRNQASTREMSMADWGIFGLACGWENTYPADDGWWNYLINDARLVDLRDRPS